MIKINILGTDYTVETHKISEDETMKKNDWSGYCGEESKKIIVADMTEEEYFQDFTDEEKEQFRKKILRHEIVHAFFNESGLQSNACRFEEAWARNEEMVDWFAIQSPKIYKVFIEMDIL